MSRNIIGEGRPSTAGGTADYASTVGDVYGGNIGRLSVYPSLQQTAVATVPNGYAITLEKENGDRLPIETIIGDFSPAREHSTISDWDAVVPYNPEELEEWTHDTRAWITWDGRVVFTGYCKNVSSSLMSGESVISGPGPGIDLDEGVYSLTFENIQVWRAFERIFDEITDWSYQVERPPEPRVIDRLEVSGTALECIEQLADEHGWNFLIHQSRWHHIEAFKPGHTTGTATWTTLDSERERSTSEYYNATGVIGGRDESGQRIIGYYENPVEISEHAAKRGLTYKEARKIQAVKEDGIETQAEADSVAQARTEEAIRNAEVTGSIETYPMLIDPGKAYPVREWDDDAKIGPYSLIFDGSSHIELPERLLSRLQDEGGFSLWARTNWFSNESLIDSDDEYNHLELGSNNNGDVEINVTSRSEQFTTSTYLGDREDEWVFLHGDWWYDDENNESTIRIGYNGEIKSSLTFKGRITFPSAIVHLGRGLNGRRYSGYMDWIQFFEKRPSESHYDDVYNGKDIPAKYLRARYRANEGPNKPSDQISDAFGGYHGTLHGVEYAGNPKILHQVEFSHGKDSADATLKFRKSNDTATQVERIKRDLNTR